MIDLGAISIQSERDSVTREGREILVMKIKA